jgi:phosphotransferase family enzyme
MNDVDNAAWPSPTGVAAVLDEVLHATHPKQARPPLTYLRRKPGRGLVAVYGSASTGSPMFTVTVDEAAMSAGLTDGDQPGSRLEHHTGVVRMAARGLTIQQFPHDEDLPDLAEAVAPREGSPLWQALSAVANARESRGDVWTLRSVEATPLRYKPGDRCVLRYHLSVEANTGSTESFSVIGKLYRTSEQAMAAAAIMERLWEAQDSRPWTARPLGVVGALPVVLSEDLGSGAAERPTLTGTDVIRFGGEAPHEALRLAARALAALHTSTTASSETAQRTGLDESAKAGKRATAIARYVPALADTTATVARSLRRALESPSPSRLRPSHGSYKPTQLLFRSGSVFVVDFDQFSLAEPALDVGYFLAYLRPPGLWYRRPGSRTWFTDAAATFLSAYAEAAAERGMDAAERDEVLRRCHIYEAALLLKIGARRSNRMHSPRPGEVMAILDEVRGLLSP